MNRTVRYTILSALMSCVACFSTSSHHFIRADKILNQKGKPTPNLLKLLATLSIKHDGTLDSIVQATQREWLRPAGKERWDAPDKHEDKRAHVLALLDQFGCLKDVHASKKQYTRVVMLGALMSRVRGRLAYLLKQWESGVRFDEIVVLGGKRPLHPKLESREILLDTNNKELPARKDWMFQGSVPKTESEMIRMVFDQADLPDKLKKTVRIVFVETPMQKRSDGSMRRPNTGDTVVHWLQMYKPQPGTCLVISNQPYVGYQDSVLRTFLPKDFEIETIGGRAYDDLPLAVHLDNFARWLYQERKRRAAQ